MPETDVFERVVGSALNAALEAGADPEVVQGIAHEYQRATGRTPKFLNGAVDHLWDVYMDGVRPVQCVMRIKAPTAGDAMAIAEKYREQLPPYRILVDNAERDKRIESVEVEVYGRPPRW